jgi:hypothetical protein
MDGVDGLDSAIGVAMSTMEGLELCGISEC